MDVERLISAVFERPCIWDKRRKDHANRNVTDKAWKEISEEMSIEDSSLRRKWKNLRDYFGSEFSKRPVPRSGDGAGDSGHESKWLYYKQMLFLKDIVAPRRCQSSLDSVINDTFTIDDAHSGNQNTVPEHVPENDDVQFDTPASSSAASPSAELQQELCTTPQTRGKKRKSLSNQSGHYQKLLDLEERKLELLSQRNNEENDDLLFLKSLLPYIKRIPEESKLSFRCEIQRVVENYAYGGQHAPNRHINYDIYHQQRTPSTVSPSFQSSTSSSHSYQSYNSTTY